MIKIKTFQPVIFTDLIERIWLLENNEASVEALCPPDPYTNLILPLSGSTWIRNGIEIKGIQIEGLNLQTIVTKYPKNTKLLGIRFYPFGLSAFSSISGKAIIDKLSPLQEIFKVIKKENFSTLALESNHEFILQNVNALLINNFNQESYLKHQIIRDFYQFYRQDKHTENIEVFSKQFSTNYSSLNRQFTKTIGITSKQFERLIKFRKALCQLTDSTDKLSHIGLDSGYFDQSHFIREFKLFMSTSPSAYHSILRKADQDSQIINYNFRLL